MRRRTAALTSPVWGGVDGHLPPFLGVARDFTDEQYGAIAQHGGRWVVARTVPTGAQPSPWTVQGRREPGIAGDVRKTPGTCGRMGAAQRQCVVPAGVTKVADSMPGEMVASRELAFNVA